MHAVRSTSRKTWGTLARNTEVFPLSSGRSVGRLDDGFGVFLKRLRPQVAAVFDHDHVSAGPADAAHRRRAEYGDFGIR